MKLLTKEILKKVPPTHTTNGDTIDCGLDPMIIFKLFAPWGNWTWLVAQYDNATGLAFGHVIGFEREWGYFNIDELQSIKGPFGLKIERDIHFIPKKFSQIKGE